MVWLAKETGHDWLYIDPPSQKKYCQLGLKQTWSWGVGIAVQRVWKEQGAREGSSSAFKSDGTCPMRFPTCSESTILFALLSFSLLEWEYLSDGAPSLSFGRKSFTVCSPKSTLGEEFWCRMNHTLSIPPAWFSGYVWWWYLGSWRDAKVRFSRESLGVINYLEWKLGGIIVFCTWEQHADCSKLNHILPRIH